MDKTSIAQLLNVAVEAAKIAGQHALNQAHRRAEAHSTADHDIKLALDVELQTIAADVIHGHFPDHDILGEEESRARPGSYRWIVDPIDGTVNFAHGFDLWCVSIGVEWNGKTQTGAVFAPARDELFTATLDGPALLNGKVIRVSDIESLAAAMVQTDTNKEAYDFPAGAALYGTLLHQAQKVRVMGSAALDICRVAQGHAEGYAALGIYPWDTAAAALILERAGGRFEIIEHLPNQRFRVVCSNGKIHEAFKGVILDTLASHPPSA